MLQSGVPPYDYDTAMPFRGDFGLSGILLEGAQFVLQAEMRKWSSIIHQDFNLYAHFSIIPPSGPYEPKADGSTLGNLLNPGQAATVDHIIETRVALLNLFAAYSNDSSKSPASHFTDWIQQAYPNHPSGYVQEDPFTQEANFLRPAVGAQYRVYDTEPSSAETGIIDTSDIHWLGGSGIFLDLDFGEVMFNPYPFPRRSELVNLYAQGDPATWEAQASPFFPAFQRTNGAIVSSNGLEIEDGIDPEVQSVNGVNDQTRFRGYPLHPSTEYFLGQGGIDFSLLSDFDFVSLGTRRTGTYSLNTVGSASLLALQAQSSGLYKVLIRNSKANFPHTAVASGQISKEPSDNIADGVWHVFNDTIWVVDVRGSGMSPISPFNGSLLWLRHGEDNGQGGRWRDNFGIERIGSSLVRSYDPAGSTLLQFHTYNDNLTHDSFVQTSDGGISFSTIGVLQDFTYDGTTYWTAHAFAGSTEGVILEIDSGLTWQKAIRVDNAGGGFGHDADKIFAMPSTGDKFFYNSTLPGSGKQNIVRFNAGDPFSPGSTVYHIDVDIPKPIDLPFSVASLTDVYDIVEINGSSILNDGVWALVGSLGFLEENLYLIRIEEQPLLWERLEIIPINQAGVFSTLGAPGGGDPNFTCIALIDLS